MHLPASQSGYEWETIPTPKSVQAVDAEPTTTFIEQLAEQEIWRVTSSRHPAGGTLEPLTPEWFQHIEAKRYRRHGRWLPKMLELDRHHQENILAIGDGLGTDWFKLATPNTTVTVVEPQADRLRLLRTHMQARGADLQLLHAPWQHLPLANDRTDVAMMLFHQRPIQPLEDILSEVFRILRPGGKVIAIVPGRFNSARWQDLVLPWRWWNKKADDENQFTNKTLQQTFGQFDQIAIYKRHLRRAELPYLWRWLPLPILERVMGRFLIIKAFKPLHASAKIRLVA